MAHTRHDLTTKDIIQIRACVEANFEIFQPPEDDRTINLRQNYVKATHIHLDSKTKTLNYKPSYAYVLVLYNTSRINQNVLAHYKYYMNIFTFYL